MYDVTQTSGMTHLYMTYNYRSLLWNIVLFCRAFQVMTWLENVARRIYIWHDSDIWHDPLKYDMTQKCGTTHSYMIWLQNVAWLIMIWHDSKMRPDSFIYDMTPYGCICRGDSFIWFIHIWHDIHMMHSYMTCLIHSYMTWLHTDVFAEVSEYIGRDFCKMYLQRFLQVHARMYLQN